MKLSLTLSPFIQVLNHFRVNYMSAQNLDKIGTEKIGLEKIGPKKNNSEVMPQAPKNL